MKFQANFNDGSWVSGYWTDAEDIELMKNEISKKGLPSKVKIFAEGKCVEYSYASVSVKQDTFKSLPKFRSSDFVHLKAINIQPIGCKYEVYSGYCKKSLSNDSAYFCAEHANQRCCKCDYAAIQDCDNELQLVCGLPLCGSCTCNCRRIFGNMSL